MLLLSVLFARVSSVENRWRAAGTAVLNTVTGGVFKPTCLFVVVDVGQGSCPHVPRASSGPVRTGVCTQVRAMGAVSGSRGVCKFWNSSWSMHAEACTSPVRRKPPLGGQAPHALRPVTEPREARAAAVTVKPLADCSFRSFPPRHLARRSTVREGATLKLAVLPVPVSRRARRRRAVGDAAVLSDTGASTSFTSRVDDDTAILCQLCFITNITTNSHHLTRHCATVSTPSPPRRRPHHCRRHAPTARVIFICTRPADLGYSQENGNRET